MPVPKRKHSRSRRDSRSANKGIKVSSFVHTHNMNATLVRQVVKRCIELLREAGPADKESVKGSMNTVCTEFGLREAQCVHPMKLAMIKLRTLPTVAPVPAEKSTEATVSA